MTVELSAVEKKREVEEKKAVPDKIEPIKEEPKTPASGSSLLGQVTLEPGQAFNQDTVLLKWVQA